MRHFLFLLVVIVTPVCLNAQNYKHEFAASYGFLSNSHIYDILSHSIGGRNEETGRSSFTNRHFFGPLSLEYYNRASRLWSFGVTGVLFDINAIAVHNNEKACIINTTLLAGAKLHWLNRQSFNMYSKLGIGVSLSGAKETSVPFILPNFQLSLLGMEVMFSRHVGIFAEAGVGEQGIIHGGMCLKK